MSKRKAPRFYVQVSSLWQGDRGKLYGPFSSRAEAQTEADSRADNSPNLTHVRETFVLTHTQCVRAFGSEFFYDQWNAEAYNL